MATPLRFLSPATYWRKLRKIWLIRTYDWSRARADQDAAFVAAGLDRVEGMRILDDALKDAQLPPFAASSGMASVHWLLFACLARQRRIRRVLEIGTFDGETTKLLATVFKEAEIATLDLPADDPILRRTYARGDEEALREYERRVVNNTRSDRITLVRRNSFFLPAVVSGKFDLIWVDGGHLFPEVAWDVCNSYHMLADGGILMCDDVILHPDGMSDGYVSPDSYRVLEYIRERTRDDLWFFLKRDSPEWSADPKKRKYVAVMRKRECLP